jgi:hypothetical protein
MADAWPMPDSISPSRLSLFGQCPLRFRVETIQKVRGSSGAAALAGTTSHLALEWLMQLDGPERTREALGELIVRALEEVKAGPEYAELSKEDLKGFDAKVKRVTPRLFDMMDVQGVKVASTELKLEVALDGWILRGIIDLMLAGLSGRLYVWDHKGLASSTPIPVPGGWKLMSQLAVGDLVFGGDGKPHAVTAKSEVKNIRCFELTFDDGSSIVCDEEHLWDVEIGTGTGRWRAETLSASQLAERGVLDDRGRQGAVRIRNVELDIEQSDLPIDPWLLGAWIGDGNRGRGEICKPLPELFDEVERLGWRVGPWRDGKTRTVLGLQRALREMGQLGSKEIPVEYMRASRGDRLALLQGLMDSDGHFNVGRRRVVMNTTSQRQAEQVAELVVSLGWSCTTHPYVATGFGKEWGAWSVTFSPSEPVFRVRNQDMVCSNAKNWRRLVKSITEVPSVPTECIAVDSPDHCYLAGRQMIKTHNTGRTPSEKYQSKAMQGIHFYAVMCELEFGEIPAKIALGYLDSRTKIAMEPTERTVSAMRSKILSTRDSIATACERDDFRPSPSKLCDWCHVKPFCPAHGGSLDDLPAPVVLQS